MSPHPIFARRRMRQDLHPAYIRAVESKINTPAEIYAYPAAARRQAVKQWRLPKVPTAPKTPTPTPSIRWLTSAYAIVLMALWTVAANIAPGA